MDVDLGYKKVNSLKTKFLKDDKKKDHDDSDTLKNCLADMFLSIVVNYDENEEESNEGISQDVTNIDSGSNSHHQTEQFVQQRQVSQSINQNDRNNCDIQSSREVFHCLSLQNIFDVGENALKKADIVNVRKCAKSRRKREDKFQDAIYSYHVTSKMLLEEEIKT